MFLSLLWKFVCGELILPNGFGHVYFSPFIQFAQFIVPYQADRYIEILLQKDSLLAIQACSYLESNTEKAVTSILNYILRTIEDKNFYYWVELGELLRKLPVSKMHEGILRKMMLYKDIIGGAAAGCLLRACGDNGKKGLLEELFQNLFGDQNDYNYMGEIAEVLSEKITLEDYKKVVSRLGSIQINVDESKEILAYGFDILAQYLPLTETVKIFNSQKNLNVLQRNILANISTAC